MVKRLADVVVRRAPPGGAAREGGAHPWACRDAPDDKDHYAGKRVTTSGVLLEVQFSKDFRRLLADVTKLCESAIAKGNVVDVKSWVTTKAVFITSSLHQCVNMGVFSGKQNGVSQNYDRFNRVATLANARKIATPINESGKVITPRQLHSSHWGICCPYATPEGKKAGLLRSLALMCRVTLGSNAAAMKEILRHDPAFAPLTGDRQAPPGGGAQKVDPKADPKAAAPKAAPKAAAPKAAAPDARARSVCALRQQQAIIENSREASSCGDAHRYTYDANYAALLRLQEPQAEPQLRAKPPPASPRGGDRRGQKANAALVKLFVNGDWIGGVRGSGAAFAQAYRARRRAGGLNPELSISHDARRREVRFCCDQGRLCRPLFVVEADRLLYTRRHARALAGKKCGWDYLVNAGVVEYIDKEEEDNTLVKFWPSELARLNAADRGRVTHCEMHPSMIFGVGAAVIPFPDRNQAPRDSYETQMAKQAIGVPGYNFDHRVKGTYNVLHYPQQPLVQTAAARTIGLWELPAGVNIVLAVAAHKGYNQEDSLVFNKAALERGLFDISRRVVFYAEAKKDKDEQFAVPVRRARPGAAPPDRPPGPRDRVCCKIRGDTAKLDRDTCCVARGTAVRKGDILIGRVVRNNARGANPEPYKDLSLVCAEPVEGRVHRVDRGTNAAGYEYVRVVVVQTRRPVIGDKFASCHAQKGTIGQIVPQENMPFSVRDGIIPDALINPLAFPSRMTVAMLIELLLGKAVCVQTPSETVPAVRGDGTPFRDFKMKEAETVLAAHGFQAMGKERMIDGISGEMLPYAVFIGPVHYQRLKHMVDDKIHARARGTHTAITRQPKEGRLNGGGFRVGYMERDNLAGQGAAGFLRDRLLENSDDYHAWFCAVCGAPAVRSVTGDGWCTLCQSREIRRVRLPYATKLLMQESNGFGVMMRVLTAP